VTDATQQDLLRASGAVFCDDRIYRYALWRRWDGEGGDVRKRWEEVEDIEMRDHPLNWIMLNPSTATEDVDDPTITRCQRFARLWGYPGVVITNLFAFRATDPSDLRGVKDPVGPLNDWWIEQVAWQCVDVVCAWGNHGALEGRSSAVLERLRDRDARLHCLGVNRTGEPVHPLYQPKDVKLTPYAPPEKE